MPHLNSRGDVAHGVGGGYLNLNNAPVQRGGAMGWIDDDTIAFIDGEDDRWVPSSYHVPTQTVVPLATQQVNHGYAGGGHAAWWGGGRGIGSTTGLTLPNAAGLLGMGPDGAIVYKADYHSYGPTQVRELNGTDWLLTQGHASFPSMQGNQQGIWTENLRPLSFNLPAPLAAAGNTWRACAFFVGNEWWITYYSDTRGIVLHPFNKLEGYAHLPKGDGWHTARAIGPNIVRVATATGEGEQAGQMWLRDYNVALDLVRDPWGANTWQPISRVPIESINTQTTIPVTPLPKLPQAEWIGYYKVTGRYGDYTSECIATGATLLFTSLHDEDTALPEGTKLQHVREYAERCVKANVGMVCAGNRADIEVLRPYWTHVACIYVTAEGTQASWSNTAYIEAQVKSIEGVLQEYGLTRRPMLLYIDGDFSTGGYQLPKGIDWQGINLYLGPQSPDGSISMLAQLRAQWDRQIKLVPSSAKLFPIFQSYDRNGQWKNDNTLKDLQFYNVEFLRNARTVGALMFSYSRPGGVLSHPPLKEWHLEMFKANPGRPVIANPPPPTQNPPKFTIVSYSPNTGPIPLRCRAVYATEAGAGRVDTIEWRYRVEGTSSWMVAVKNPGWDVDHTYTFATPGRYEISAKTYGPGGTWETGAKRLVIAERPFEPPPPPPPPPANTYLEGTTGVQVGFGLPVGHEIYQALAARHWDMARITASGDRALNQRMVDEVVEQGIRPLVLCFPEQVQTIPEWVDIEILNEPDIGGYQWPKVNPEAYAQLVNEIMPIARERHMRVWAGAISNTSKEGLAWLGRVVALLADDVGVSIHRYPQRPGDAPSVPRTGHASRAAEIAAVKAIIGNRPWGVTEFGWKQDPYNTASSWWERFLGLLGVSYTARLTDAQQAQYASDEFDLWLNTAGAEFAIWYQLNDADGKELFGLRRADGTWKPVADIFN